VANESVCRALRIIVLYIHVAIDLDASSSEIAPAHSTDHNLSAWSKLPCIVPKPWVRNASLLTSKPEYQNFVWHTEYVSFEKWVRNVPYFESAVHSLFYIQPSNTVVFDELNITPPDHA
jgi:hypothetical protein